ncbi:hypothetical protein [Kribbella lupini]|uniref:Uncharacterized protein n=1 Tax=Kribbella lupini TaxID=291602 RepID=A0ABN2BA29_9ACTN
MQTLEAKRIAKTNDERAALAARHGWGFATEGSGLADRWRYALPFCLRGKDELAFGVVSGRHHGLRFTAFDYHRQVTLEAVRDAWTDGKVPKPGAVRINTVWAIELPAKVPWFQIVENADPAYDLKGMPEPLTTNPNFSRWYRLVNTNPQVAAQILHPELMKSMRRNKLHTWALMEQDLVATVYPIFGRTRPDELLKTLDRLTGLISLLPLPVLEQYR